MRRRVWVAYCIAHTGKSLLWAASDLLTLYILVERYRMAPGIAGGLFLAGLTASALADLCVGVWLGRRPGDATRLAVTGLCVAGIAFPLTIVSAPSGWGVVLAATMVFRIAYAGYDVPHNALMSRLACDAAQATALSRGRTICTGIASIAAVACIGGDGGWIGVAPMLWVIGGTATLLGLTMVPLLARFPLAGGGEAVAASSHAGLPWTFLLATTIGMVALGALGKAVLHLSGVSTPADGMAMLAILIAGRTASALAPVRFVSIRQGLSLFASTFAVSAALPVLFVTADHRSVALLLLGLVMGLSNLIGWALLSLLARDARDYGIYTMASKLALGATGLALAGGLGRASMFTAPGFLIFATGVAAACVTAVALCLTCACRYDLHRR